MRVFEYVVFVCVWCGGCRVSVGSVRGGWLLMVWEFVGVGLSGRLWGIGRWVMRGVLCNVWVGGCIGL